MPLRYPNGRTWNRLAVETGLFHSKPNLVSSHAKVRELLTGRARMAVIPDFKAVTLTTFLKQNVATGSTLYTDGLKSFTGIQEAGFKHVPRNQPLRIDLR
jgi:transposase-like protein